MAEKHPIAGFEAAEIAASPANLSNCQFINCEKSARMCKNKISTFYLSLKSALILPSFEGGVLWSRQSQEIDGAQYLAFLMPDSMR